MAHDPIEHVVDAERELHILGDWNLPLPHVTLFGHEFLLTKFMLLELLAAILIIVIFVPLCRRAAAGGLPKGPFWNAFDSMLTFIRDKVAKPALGEHDADRFMPLLWTMFFFILFCNLLGMIPLLGSPTASIWVTGGLALVSFLVMHAAGVAKMGGLHYLKSLWPHVDAPVAGVNIGPLISAGLFVIELGGTVIKSGVLAVRLFANMFAGHMVLATILTFIVAAGEMVESGQMHGSLWAGITVASLFGVIALSLLELFVAFLQAYVFVFLTALFIGMSLHPQH
jgi:F-type H+-transporting ATPase subunit a